MIIEQSNRATLVFSENSEIITHLRRMLSNLLELEDVAGLTVAERNNVKMSVRAMRAGISALESQCFA